MSSLNFHLSNRIYMDICLNKKIDTNFWWTSIVSLLNFTSVKIVCDCKGKFSFALIAIFVYLIHNNVILYE